MIFGSSRTGDANDPEVYTTAVISILMRYPEDVMRAAAEPYSGVVQRSKGFLPRLDEVKDFCEEIVTRWRRAAEREANIRKQLAERDEFEAIGPRKIPQHIIDELAEHGLLKDKKLKHLETPAKVMARLGLTQEQWDALPNAK